MVSGAALGIDAAAHEAALSVDGVTIGVLPSPPPLGMRRGAGRLAAAIPRRGALVADQPPGTPPARWSFAARNALLAALCDGVIVVEAPLESGALITAEAAVERGIPVAIVTAPFGTTTARGGWEWYSLEIDLSVRHPERLPPVLLSDRTSLFAWMAELEVSLREDRSVTIERSLSADSGVETLGQEAPLPLWAPDHETPRGALLATVAAAGVDGVTEGDLLLALADAGSTLPALLSLLAAEGWVEQQAGRWRLSEEAVLRSRA